MSRPQNCSCQYGKKVRPTEVEVAVVGGNRMKLSITFLGFIAEIYDVKVGFFM